MSDTIVRHSIVLPASRERVWQAISDSRRFGTWFGAAFDGPFVAGQAATGQIVPTKVDPDVARLQEPYAGTRLEIVIAAIIPLHTFAFRWHPFALGPAEDYVDEPTTLVSFDVAEAGADIQLTVTETGFDDLPPARRDAAFAANNGGWAHQVRLIERYLVDGFDQ